ncbi:unnamed protein product [Ceutorhynchus assimilis]|uniref:Dynein regulatory complex protein 10 n=1 Tax=Ceutorhynchus assimilis TaxID=467358 RepID=A0A9N9QLX1_9CUCU|nr:unnamed protein product [Ceutorhynchus assimilis]
MNPKQILEKFIKPLPKPFNSILKNADKLDHFKGLDLDKPETFTPMEMELRIQADQVMFSLNKAVSVLSILAQLPQLLDSGILTEHFTHQEMSYVYYVLRRYETKEERVSDEDTFLTYGGLYEIVNKIKLKSYFQETVVDANLSQIVHMIFNNRCIRDAIKKIPKPKTIPYVMQFIKDFQELKDMAQIKLYITGTEEEKRDKQLRQAFKSNIMLKAAIKDLEHQLEHQRDQLGTELHKKVDIFDNYNDKIANIKEEFQISIEKNIHDSEKRMMQQCMESEAKQAQLALEADSITKAHAALLEQHLASEKLLRARTGKTQALLHNWIIKYDQDAGDKNTEYEDLKKQYDQEKETMDDLDDKLDEQEKIYITLMAEKAEEEERIYHEIYFKILTNRSARIIQRAWRAYRERRKSRRRGKKGKKDFRPKLVYTKKDDPNALLEGKFKGDIFD